MRKMAAETGESLGPEFDEVVGRLEKGEDPDKIERDMGELLGAPEGPGGMDGDDGMMGMGGADSPSAPPAEATPEPKSGARRRPKTAKPSKPAKVSGTHKRKPPK